jgi:hypothetical protein
MSRKFALSLKSLGIEPQTAGRGFDRVLPGTEHEEN